MTFGTKHYAARVENLTAAKAFVEECADRYHLDGKKKYGLLLAFEEAFVNICSYAYPAGDGRVALSCGDVDNTFVLEIADGGEPFDLLSLPAPDTTSDVMDRQLGGLGIHFIRTLPDNVSYRREGNRNILRMVFKRSLPR